MLVDRVVYLEETCELVLGEEDRRPERVEVEPQTSSTFFVTAPRRRLLTRVSVHEDVRATPRALVMTRVTSYSTPSTWKTSWARACSLPVQISSRSRAGLAGSFRKVRRRSRPGSWISAPIGPTMR